MAGIHFGFNRHHRKGTCRTNSNHPLPLSFRAIFCSQSIRTDLNSMENSTMYLPFYTSFKTLLSIFVILLAGATLCAVDSKDLKKLKEGECQGCDLRFAQILRGCLGTLNYFNFSNHLGLIFKKVAGLRKLWHLKVQSYFSPGAL